MVVQTEYLSPGIAYVDDSNPFSMSDGKSLALVVVACPHPRGDAGHYFRLSRDRFLRLQGEVRSCHGDRIDVVRQTSWDGSSMLSCDRGSKCADSASNRLGDKDPGELRVTK